MPLASNACAAWLLLCAPGLATASSLHGAGDAEGECNGQTCASAWTARSVDEAGLLQLAPTGKEEDAFLEAEVDDMEAASTELVHASSLVGVTGYPKHGYDAMPEVMRNAVDALGPARVSRHGSTGRIRKCKFDKRSDCSIKSLSKSHFTGIMPHPRTWGTHCINAESPYMFQVYPGRSDKLLVYYQHGGACWEPFSASLPYEFTKGVCREEIVVQGEDGIFDMNDEENPYKDFTVVHVNSCSGDAHVGNAFHDWGRQAGYNNTMAALAWAKHNMDISLSHLAISGASVGGLGAQLWARTLLSEFQAGKRSYHSASVVVDSFLGMLPKKTEPYIFSQAFRLCDTPLGRGWSKKCGSRNCGETLLVQDAVSETMKMFRDVPFLFINSKADSSQGRMYSAVAFTLKQKIVELDKKTIYGMATNLLKRLSHAPNFAVFLVDGTHHVFLPRVRCAKSGADCEGDVYHAKATGPLAGLDGGSGGASLVSWLNHSVHRRQTSDIESVCHGTVAVHNKSRVFPTHLCDQSLKGKRLQLRGQ